MGASVAPCHICSAPTVVGCRLCGKPACGAHIDASTGICSACAGYTGAN
jgi:hypothetical protein